MPHETADRDRLGSLRPLLAPFVPDPFEGRAWFGHWPTSTARVLPAKSPEARRPERDRREHRKWDAALAEFGLSNAQVNGSGETQVVIIPKGDEPPLRTVDSDSQLQANHGVPWRTCSAIPIQVHEREVPDWTQSDSLCREYILHLYSNGFEGGRPRCRERARARAAKVAYVIYRWFRELAKAESIAADSGMTVDQVLRAAEKIRKHGFPHGDKRCCLKWRRKVSE